MGLGANLSGHKDSFQSMNYIGAFECASHLQKMCVGLKVVLTIRTRCSKMFNRMGLFFGSDGQKHMKLSFVFLSEFPVLQRQEARAGIHVAILSIGVELEPTSQCPEGMLHLGIWGTHHLSVVPLLWLGIFQIFFF